MDRTEELQSQVRELTRHVTELRSRLLSLEGAAASPAVNGTRSRRDLLKLGGVAALGVVGAAALRPEPARALTGGNFLLGSSNLAENPTVLTADGGTNLPTQVLAVQSQSFAGQSAIDSANNPTTPTNPFFGAIQGLGGAGNFDGVDGWASGSTAYAIYGFTDAGTGVVGDSVTGVSLYARRSGRIRQDARAAGLPNYAPVVPEQVRDANGVLWINNPTGMWRRVNTVRTDAADGSGNSFKPLRLVDTRIGTGGVTGPLANGSTTSWTVAGMGSGNSTIPADAIGVVGNVTATGFTRDGFLAVMPFGTSFNPAADPSSLNFTYGQIAIANAFLIGLSGGKLSVYVGLGSGAGGSTQVIVDINAYIQ